MVGRIMSVSFVALGVTFAAVGCGGSDPDKPKLGKVTGTVTYKGKPLTRGSVASPPSRASPKEAARLPPARSNPTGRTA